MAQEWKVNRTHKRNGAESGDVTMAQETSYVDNGGTAVLDDPENGSVQLEKHRWRSEEARNRQLAELRTPWKKGQSGNPTGRKPGQTIRSLIKEFGQRKTNLAGEPLPNGATFNEAVVESVAYAAIGGNMQAALIWLEWHDGKLTNHSSVELSRATDADLKAMAGKHVAEWLDGMKEVTATASVNPPDNGSTQ